MEASSILSVIRSILLLIIYNTMIPGGNCVSRGNDSFEETDSNIFSEECLQRHKIYFDDDCYSLLTKASCPEGQWLVLDSAAVTEFKKNNNINNGNDNENALSRLKATCSIKRCSNNNYVYWPETDSCQLSTAADKQFCREPGTALKTNSFGVGVCDCLDNPPHVRLRSCDGHISYGCYPLYGSGICGRTCIVRETEYGFGECTPNICAWGSGAAHEPDAWLFRSEDGFCYRRNTTGPCDTHERFDVHPLSRKPACVDDLTENNLVGNIPSICATNYEDDCATDGTATVDKSAAADYFRQTLIRDSLMMEREKSKDQDNSEER